MDTDNSRVVYKNTEWVLIAYITPTNCIAVNHVGHTEIYLHVVDLIKHKWFYSVPTSILDEMIDAIIRLR